MAKRAAKQPPAPARPVLHEDWLAVLIAFLLILLAGVGLLGPNGINIPF